MCKKLFEKSKEEFDTAVKAFYVSYPVFADKRVFRSSLEHLILAFNSLIMGFFRYNKAGRIPKSVDKRMFLSLQKYSKKLELTAMDIKNLEEVISISSIIGSTIEDFEKDNSLF